MLQKAHFQLFWKIPKFDVWVKNIALKCFGIKRAHPKHTFKLLVFRFRNISGQYFASRHQISYFFKKVGNALFAANLLTSAEYSTFSSQIVRYGQTNIATLKSGPRRCFHIPIMLPYHIYISFSNSRKKIFIFSFLCIFP